MELFKEHNSVIIIIFRKFNFPASRIAAGILVLQKSRFIMKKKDFILALLVVIVWGANFTVIKLGLDGVPSMLLVVLRYIASTFPAIFFVKRPNIGLKHFIIYSLNVGVLQFACVFYALELGMPASLSSIILQLQAFISLTLAFIYLHEKLKASQLVGIHCISRTVCNRNGLRIKRNFSCSHRGYFAHCMRSGLLVCFQYCCTACFGKGCGKWRKA